MLGDRPSSGTEQLFFIPIDTCEESGIRELVRGLSPGFDAKLKAALIDHLGVKHRQAVAHGAGWCFDVIAKNRSSNARPNCVLSLEYRGSGAHGRSDNLL